MSEVAPYTIHTIAPLPEDLAREITSIASIEDCAALRKMLDESLRLTVYHVIRLAAIIRRLDDLGEEWQDVVPPVLAQYRRVAHGQLLADALVRFQATPVLLSKIAACPIPEQRSLCRPGATVPVYLPSGDHRAMPPSLLNTHEIRQVFASDHVRDQAEQLSYLRDRAEAASAAIAIAPAPPVEPFPVVDYRRGGILVGRCFVPVADLARYLAMLTGKGKGKA